MKNWPFVESFIEGIVDQDNIKLLTGGFRQALYAVRKPFVSLVCDDDDDVSPHGFPVFNCVQRPECMRSVLSLLVYSESNQNKSSSKAYCRVASLQSGMGLFSNEETFPMFSEELPGLFAMVLNASLVVR